MKTAILRSFAIAAALTLAPEAAQAAGCEFDAASLSFAGSAKEQAACLLRRVEIGGRLAPQPVPAAILARVGTEYSPTEAQLGQALARLPGTLAASLLATRTRRVSATASGKPALYFVIHDTSSPYLRDQPFPAEINADPGVNRISGYLGPNAVAHYFVNRRGEAGMGHDFSVPWRATKLETKVVGAPSRGRFLHIEMLQPRRRDPINANPNNDRLAPQPGFSDAQYRVLAGLYILASARAGNWLIPAFHAAIDDGLPDGHDDPQRFDLAKFDRYVSEALGAR